MSIRCFSWNVADNDNFVNLVYSMISKHNNEDIIVVHLQETNFFSKSIELHGYKNIHEVTLHNIPGYCLRSYMYLKDGSDIKVKILRTKFKESFYKNMAPTKGYISMDIEIDKQEYSFINIHNFAPKKAEKSKYYKYLISDVTEIKENTQNIKEHLSTNKTLPLELIYEQLLDSTSKLISKHLTDTKLNKLFLEINKEFAQVQNNIHNILNRPICELYLNAILAAIENNFTYITNLVNEDTFNNSILKKINEITSSHPTTQFYLFGDLNSRNTGTKCSIPSLEQVYSKNQIENCTYVGNLDSDYLLKHQKELLPGWSFLDETELKPTYKILFYNEKELIYEEGASKHPKSFPDRVLTKGSTNITSKVTCLDEWMLVVSNIKCKTNPIDCSGDTKKELEIAKIEKELLKMKNILSNFPTNEIKAQKNRIKEKKEELKKLRKTLFRRPVSDHIPITFTVLVTSTSYKQKYIKLKIKYHSLKKSSQCKKNEN